MHGTFNGVRLKRITSLKYTEPAPGLPKGRWIGLEIFSPTRMTSGLSVAELGGGAVGPGLVVKVYMTADAVVA